MMHIDFLTSLVQLLRQAATKVNNTDTVIGLTAQNFVFGDDQNLMNTSANLQKLAEIIQVEVVGTVCKRTDQYVQIT